HRVEHPAAYLIAHPVMEVAARTDLLQRREIASLVMNAGEPVADKLFGNVREPIALALFDLLLTERHARADAVECIARAIGDAPVQVAVRIAIEGAAGGIRRVLVHARHLERLAVVVRRVTAAVADDDRMVERYLVEVVHVQFALILHFGVVEEEPFDPVAWRRLTGLRPEFVDDARDRDELDLEWIAHEHF